MLPGFIKKNTTLIIYGVILAILLFLLRWLKLRFMILDHVAEVYIGMVALLFTGLGIWLAVKLTKPAIKTIIQEKVVIVPGQSDFNFNIKEQQRLGISKRELEVLQLMSEGCSNQEIANRLFISLSTIKTHSSSLFEKLDVKRRTQAVEKARKLQLIP